MPPDTTDPELPAVAAELVNGAMVTKGFDRVTAVKRKNRNQYGKKLFPAKAQAQCCIPSLTSQQTGQPLFQPDDQRRGSW